MTALDHAPSEAAESQVARVVPTFSRALRADLRAIADELTHEQVGYLVDLFYQLQRVRIQQQHRVTAATRAQQPRHLLALMGTAVHTLESALGDLLGHYAERSAQGRWLLSVHGIGPVLAGGLVATFPNIPPTVGSWWRFAGLDPTVQWLPRETVRAHLDELVPARQRIATDAVARLAHLLGRRVETLLRYLGDPPYAREAVVKACMRRPWCARARELAWKVGESFIAQARRPKCLYGRAYWQRRLHEDAHHFGLAQAHRRARARRWTVKLFLSHYHTACYWYALHELPPAPYPIAIMGHQEYWMPPHVDADLEAALLRWVRGARLHARYLHDLPIPVREPEMEGDDEPTPPAA